MKTARRLTPASLIVWLLCFAAPCAAVAAVPEVDSNSTFDSPPIQPFSEDADPSAPDSASDQTPAYRRIHRPPVEYLNQPAPSAQIAAPQYDPPQPDPLQYDPPTTGFIQPQQPARALLASWLPEGLIPGWGSTPDSRKDRGIGVPLKKGSWRSQPFSISGFAGATNGGPLIRGHVLERPSFYGGANFGWDYDHYWGIEKRLGFGALNLTNAQHQPLQQGLSVTGEYRLMWYPLGDTRWRPFLTTGIGWSDFYFQDDFNRHHLDTLLLFPFGGGLKYQLNDRLAVRIDLIDELTFAGGAVNTFHYVALTAGLEFRYGKRLLHLPWHKKENP